MLGAVLPLVAIALPPMQWRVPVSVVVVVGLGLAGVGQRPDRRWLPRRAVARLTIGGTLGLAVTYGVGPLLGAAAAE